MVDLKDVNVLYHLSDGSHDGETFVPRQIPKWRIMEGEDWRTKRICVSTTIDDALVALLSYDSQPFGKHLFVHVVDNIDVLKSKNKIYVPTSKQVPDVEATHEIWVKAPATLKLVGKIEVVDIDANNDVFYLDPKTKNDANPLKIHLDRFIWKWVFRKEMQVE